MCGTFTGVQLHRSGYVRDASRSFKINNFGGGYITFFLYTVSCVSVVRWSYQGEFILNPFSLFLFTFPKLTLNARYNTSLKRDFAMISQ